MKRKRKKILTKLGLTPKKSKFSVARSTEPHLNGATAYILNSLSSKSISSTNSTCVSAKCFSHCPLTLNSSPELDFTLMAPYGVMDMTV